MRGELEAELNCNISTPTLMATTAFLSLSTSLLNRGAGGPASLWHVPHSSIFSPTGLISNCLTSCLHQGYIIVRHLPSSCGRHKSHSIQPVHGQGYILIILEGGARGVMVIVVELGHDDTSSNPGRYWLHFT